MSGPSGGGRAGSILIVIVRELAWFGSGFVPAKMTREKTLYVRTTHRPSEFCSVR